MTNLIERLKSALRSRKAMSERVRAAELIAEHALRQAECYRAQLMQLRVYQDTAPKSARVGWMVSAFIPNETVEKLRRMSDERKNFFTTTVAKVLVGKALDGILSITRRGKCTALIYEPVHNDPNKRIVSELFEKDEARFEIDSANERKRKAGLLLPPFTPRQVGWRDNDEKHD